MDRRTKVLPDAPTKRRGETVTRRVLEIALDQLALRGFAGLSIPEVARLAGLNKTSVYRRWPTKADLVRDALNVSMGGVGERPDSGDLRADLLAIARVAVEFVESPRGRGVLRTLLAEGADPEVRSVAGALFRSQQITGPRRVLARAIARGDLPENVDVRLVLTTVAGALMHRVVVEDARVTETFLERLIDLVLFGATRDPHPAERTRG